MAKIVIQHPLFEKMVNIARSHHPEESCAAIFGTSSKIEVLTYHISQIIELQNTVHSPVEFRIDEEELYPLWKKYTKMKLDLLGVFHSHPDTAYLSSYDKMTIKHISKAYPSWIWIVYGSRSHQLKAFILQSHQFVEIPICERQ